MEEEEGRMKDRKREKRNSSKYRGYNYHCSSLTPLHIQIRSSGNVLPEVFYRWNGRRNTGYIAGSLLAFTSFLVYFCRHIQLRSEKPPDLGELLENPSCKHA